MATAVKNTPETGAPSLFDRAAAVSLVGVVYVIGSLGIVFKLLPYLFWDVLRIPAVNTTYLLLAVLLFAAVIGLIVGGVFLLGNRAPHGTRAGIFVGVVGVLLILLITRWASIWFEYWSYSGNWYSPIVGAILTAAVGLVLLGAGGYYFLHPKFEPYLIKIEDQGWFSTTTFKPQQGFRVRLGTIVGILILVGAGLWTLNGGGGTGPLWRLPPNWTLNVPFTGKANIDLVEMFKDELSVTAQLNSQGKIPPEERDRRKVEAVLNYVQEAGKPRDGKEPALSINDFLAKRLREKFPNEFNTWVAQCKDYVDKKSPTSPALVVDRYALRDFDRELADYAYVVSDGDAPNLTKFAVFEKTAVEKAVKEATDKPVTEPVMPVRGVETFATVQLLPMVQYTLLFLLAGLACWVAWRIVHFPVFADFLIATEAELNKVSWTTRKKLIQDTIVVLVTVFLMAVYLFAMDQAWSQLLSWKPIRILQLHQENPDNKPVENKPW